MSKAVILANRLVKCSQVVHMFLKHCVTKILLIHTEEDGRLLEQSLTEAQARCQSAVEAALFTIMAPVSSQLATIPDLPAWTSRPGTSAQLSSSFSPQEYITQVTHLLAYTQNPQQLAYFTKKTL